MKIKKERCRHERNSWLIVGGFAEWCYVCGSYRNLKEVKGGLAPLGEWHRPSGDKNINPYKLK